MAKTTTKKTTGKPKAKSQSKPKSSSKPRAAKKTATGKTKTVKVATIKNPKFQKAAKLATDLALSDGNGGTVKRGPVSTPQVEKVAALIGRRKPSDFLTKTLGFTGMPQATKYASGKLGRKELPDGTSRAMSEASKQIGTPTKHKINGRKLAAILVALAK